MKCEFIGIEVSTPLIILWNIHLKVELYATHRLELLSISSILSGVILGHCLLRQYMPAIIFGPALIRNHIAMYTFGSLYLRRDISPGIV